MIDLDTLKWYISSEAVVPDHSPSAHSPDELDCKPEVSYTAGSITFHQDVLTLQVPVSNGRFALGAKDLCVQVAKAWHRGVGQSQHGFIIQSGWFEVVVQWAVFMVVCDQVELSPRACSFNICSYETYEWSTREGLKEK